ncbi:MAG: hypothetical protein M0Z48_01360 [Nitrospiraceae bacterium]|nr:hypothetical protein [Nitrospiraceae bacterium]
MKSRTGDIKNLLEKPTLPLDEPSAASRNSGNLFSEIQSLQAANPNSSRKNSIRIRKKNKVKNEKT